MKKILAAALVMVFASTAVMAASIVNSKHNLTTSGTGSYKNAGTTEICVFCHTPHAGNTAAPLWNRSATTGQTYNLYSSSTLTGVTLRQPANNISAACLTCHDGTIGMSSLLNQPNVSPATPFMGDKLTWGMAAIGIDLRDDHPVSFTYNEGDTVNFFLKSAATASGVKFYGASLDQVECASCHNVHDNANAPFLRMANTGSAMCLSCHKK